MSLRPTFKITLKSGLSAEAREETIQEISSLKGVFGVHATKDRNVLTATGTCTPADIKKVHNVVNARYDHRL